MSMATGSSAWRPRAGGARLPGRGRTAPDRGRGPRRLGGDLAYTTVLTALSRLHAKGALHREPSGRAFAYSLPADPAAVGASVTARRMSRLLDSGEDRAGVLARFVADLSPEDERLLTELLDRGRAEGGEAPA